MAEKLTAASTPALSKDLISRRTDPPRCRGFDTLSCQNATAGMSCTLQSSSCTEVGGIKIIDGVEIETDCWEQTQEYRCIETVNENSCEALEKIAACKEQSSKCIDKVGLRCYAMEKEILCQTNEAIDPGPAQEITSDIVISGLTWSETCQPLDNNPDCSVLNTVCTEPGGTKRNQRRIDHQRLLEVRNHLRLRCFKRPFFQLHFLRTK